jgi:hypothetical protein
MMAPEKTRFFDTGSGKLLSLVLPILGTLVGIVLGQLLPRFLPATEVGATLLVRDPGAVQYMTKGAYLILANKPTANLTKAELDTAGMLAIYSAKYTGLSNQYCEVVWSEYDSRSGQLESDPTVAGLTDYYTPTARLITDSKLKWLPLPVRAGSYNIVAKLDCRGNSETPVPDDDMDIAEINQVPVAPATSETTPLPEATFTPSPTSTSTLTSTPAPGQTRTPPPTGVLTTPSPTTIIPPPLRTPIEPYPDWPRIPIPQPIPIENPSLNQQAGSQQP